MAEGQPGSAPNAPEPDDARRPWYHSLWLPTVLLLLLTPAVLEGTEDVGLGLLYVLGAIALPRTVYWLYHWGVFWFGRAHRRRQALVLILVGVVMAGWTRIAQLDARVAAAEMTTGEQAETVYLPPATMLKVASLGYPNFLSDLLFLRAAHYFHDHLEGDRIFEHLETYVEAVKALDPYNKRLYGWAAQVVKLGQVISKDVIARSNSYAFEGLEYFPDDWRLYWDIGFNYFHDYPADDAEEEQAMRKKALPYIALAAALPGSELDANFVSGLYERENDEEMAVFHLYLRYWEASPEQREQIRGNLVRHGSLANAERLKRLEERWRSDKPYVPITLYEVVGTAGQKGLVPVGEESWATLEP